MTFDAYLFGLFLLVLAASTTMSKPLRDFIPLVATFIDELREVFGSKEINAQIKLGMHGAQKFHAVENGIEVGRILTSR